MYVYSKRDKYCICHVLDLIKIAKSGQRENLRTFYHLTRVLYQLAETARL